MKQSSTVLISWSATKNTKHVYINITTAAEAAITTTTTTTLQVMFTSDKADK